MAPDLPPSPIPLHADPVRLAQVVGNLLNNARNHTPPGGRVTVSASVHGERAALRVADTGCGIRAEALPRIFDLFYRGERASGGLGIGLALVQQLVELHGGKVAAASDGPGRGTEVTVVLPIAPAEGARAIAAAAETPEVPRDETRRALVVDDHRHGAGVGRGAPGDRRPRTAFDGPGGGRA